MTNEEKEFWEKIKRWHLDDIQKAISAEAYVGAAKLICCAIDALAGFRFGAQTHNGSKYRFINFVKEFMPAFKTRLRSEVPIVKNGNVVWERRYSRSVLRMLYENFRCGLIHEGLPGIGTEIVFCENNEALFFSPSADLIRINIVGFHELLKSVFCEYERRLNSETKLRENFRKRVQYLRDTSKINLIK